MKKAQIKFGFAILFVLVATMGLFFACEKTEPAQFDGEFLQLSPNANLKDYFNLSESDKQILTLAEKRIGITKKNGIIYLCCENGKDVQVSQEIFLYFKEIISRTNEIYGNVKNRKRRVLPGEGAVTDRTKCVSFLLGHIFKRFGEDTTKYNQKTIDQWIVTNGYDKGGGVQPENIETVLKHFTKCSEIDSSSWPSSGYNSEKEGGPAECFIAVCENGIGAIGHVVQIVKVFEQDHDYYLGYNPQDIGSKGEQGMTLVDKRTIGRVYKISDVIK